MINLKTDRLLSRAYGVRAVSEGIMMDWLDAIGKALAGRVSAGFPEPFEVGMHPETFARFEEDMREQIIRSRDRRLIGEDDGIISIGFSCQPRIVRHAMVHRPLMGVTNLVIALPAPGCRTLGEPHEKPWELVGVPECEK